MPIPNNYYEPDDVRAGRSWQHKMIEEVEDYAILMLRPDGTVENWNRGAAHIKGYTAEEIVGRHFRIFYPEEDQERQLPETLLHEAATRGKATHEGWRVRKDGTRFWGSIVITALHNDHGEIIGFTKVTRDLTERKLAEDRLRQYAELLEIKNRDLEEFARVAGHDLRAPLPRIVKYGNLLLRKSEHLDEESRTYVRRMQASARRMQELIDGLLELIRLDSYIPVRYTVDLNQIVADVIEDLETDIEAKNAQITVGPLPELPATPVQMRQLFQNLLANSLKFNDKDDPRIEIQAERLEAEDTPTLWRITVSDNGIGFDADQTERIFQVFRRLHSDMEYTGTGLGLALCRKIVERHGGTISAQGTPGVGAVFVIELPG